MTFASVVFGVRQKGKFCLQRFYRPFLIAPSLCHHLVMEQLPQHTITTISVLAVHVSRSCRTFLNHIEEFDQQQTHEEEHRRVTKRKGDEYDLAVLAAAVPAFSASIRRFWVDVRSGEWNTLFLNGIMLQGERFAKTFRMSRDSFAILHDLLGIALDNHC